MTVPILDFELKIISLVPSLRLGMLFGRLPPPVFETAAQ